LWYTGHNGSSYAQTVGEYSGPNNTFVGSGMTHEGHIIDTSNSSGGDPTSVLAEVCKQFSAGNILPHTDGNGYYPVYSDVPRGLNGFCAYHSYGYCGGVQVQTAFFFNLDGDVGCDPADDGTITGHSQGLAALANVTAHEISEARSDPASPFAWYDANGDENGDKCAWTFRSKIDGSPILVVFNPPGGPTTQWKLQGEWSNAAYTAGTGYPNSLGQKGCIDGNPFP
jgi:hypothetical protein